MSNCKDDDGIAIDAENLHSSDEISSMIPTNGGCTSESFPRVAVNSVSTISTLTSSFESNANVSSLQPMLPHWM